MIVVSGKRFDNLSLPPSERARSPAWLGCMIATRSADSGAAGKFPEHILTVTVLC